MNLIRSLDPVRQAPNPIELAHSYIEIIAKHSRVILADNCFWSDGAPAASRSKGVCGKQPPKATTASDVSAFFNVETHRRRPPRLFRFDHKPGTKNGKKPSCGVKGEAVAPDNGHEAVQATPTDGALMMDDEHTGTNTVECPDSV